MRNIVLTLILLIVIAVTSEASVPYPVVFVHGTGDSSVAWKTTGPAVSKYFDEYYKTDKHPYFRSGNGISSGRWDKDESDNIRNSCVYLVFSDHYEDPAKLVVELKDIIADTREEVWANFPDQFRSKEEIKVNLVCHSMGGLIARKYLTDNINDHHVSKLILIGTPNKGSLALEYEWVPASFIYGGIFSAALFNSPPMMILTLTGIAFEKTSQNMGVKLRSASTGAMKPSSKFIIDLNKRKMPADVDYTVILSNADDFLSSWVNGLFGYEKGDGAVPYDSQSLKYAGLPNISELKYQEMIIVSPHAEEPSKAEKEIIEALGLKQ